MKTLSFFFKRMVFFIVLYSIFTVIQEPSSLSSWPRPVFQAAQGAHQIVLRLEERWWLFMNTWENRQGMLGWLEQLQEKAE